MTIKDLHKFLQDKDIYRTLSFSRTLRGESVAIDTSELLYRFRYLCVKSMIKTSIFCYEDGEGWSKLCPETITKALCDRFARYVSGFKVAGVHPMFVLDGKAPDEKKFVSDARMKIRLDAEKEVDAARVQPDLQRYIKSLLSNNSILKEDRIAVLDLLVNTPGVTVYQADNEADSLIAHLCKTKVCFASLSSDGDQFAWGCPFIIKTLDLDTDKMMVTTLGRVLEVLELTQRQFVTSCAAVGCDYSKGVKGISWCRFLPLIKQHGSVEEVCLKDPHYKGYDWETATKIFESVVSMPLPITAAEAPSP
jgi:5'-3' exonuclease